MNKDFENLNMTNLREVLCEIIFGDDQYKKYIVPLQGNWYNPSNKDKAGTWIGYAIDNFTSRESIVQEGNNFYRDCQTEIHLCFIGNQAEELGQSVLWWNARADVQDLLDKKYKGVMNNKEIILYSTLYEQEGLNSTLCWAVDITLRHNMLLKATSPKITYADLTGNLIIGG